jgi:alanine dehydrogenase
MRSARQTGRAVRLEGTIQLTTPVFISDEHAATALTPATLLKTVEDALAGIARGQVLNGGKVSIALDDEDGVRALHAMIGVLPKERIAGVKWVGTYDRNRARGLPRAPATMILTDSVTGALLAIVESTSLTAQRTAAAAVVAARNCARRPPRRVGILGFGAIGKSLVSLLALISGLETIAIWGGNSKRLHDEAELLRSKYGLEIVVSDRPEGAAMNADVIFTASGLSEDKPFLTRAMIREHTVVCAMGSYQEISDDIIQSSEMLVVDDWVGCSKRGNLASAVRRGLLTRSSVHWELPDLVARGGSIAERVRSPTVVMIGLGALDVAIAKELLTYSGEPRCSHLSDS